MVLCNMQTESIGGGGVNKYFLLFVDDRSRMCWVFCMKYKADALVFFQKFRILVEKQSGHEVKTLRSDRGGEFMNKDFIAYCEDHDIKRELTAPSTPQQNGMVERNFFQSWR